MRRTILNERIVIRYAIGDRVVVVVDDEHRPGKIIFLGKQLGEEPIYRIRLDGERKLRDVPIHGIVKQADTGGLGPVQHLERI